ncbi:MAG: response regulator [Desulfobacteraceae bacterium]|nr:response regulator [Desulfobacteraceae bacterium]MBC2755055.1 response regulator [Desulfobacteraceae bacterium]
MNILVVDDEERIRSVFVKIMQRDGFHVIEAANVADAYELLLENPVDLILLDINMMDVDGTVLYEIAQIFCEKSKIIITSVYPLEDQKRLIRGAADYYDKSDSLQVLIRKVNRLNQI